MVNKVFLIGRVGNEPTEKTFQDGGRIVSFSLATTERGYKTKEGKEVADKTTWHNIRVKGNFAKVVLNYVHKGDLLHIVGKYFNDEYVVNNDKKYYYYVVADEINFISKKTNNSETNSNTIIGADNEKEDDLPF